MRGMISVQSPSTPLTPSTIRRNRLFFVVGAVGVLGIGGIFAHAAFHALYVRSITGSVFANYVIQHHIGQADVTDDASGFQGDMCTLYLNKPIPQAKLKQTTVGLAYQYYSLDGGDTLTITYTDATTHRQVVEASSFYPGGSTLMVTLNEGARKLAEKVPVDWPSNGADGS